MEILKNILIKLHIIEKDATFGPFRYRAEDSIIAKNAVIAGSENMTLGKKSYIGEGCLIYTTNTTLDIGNYVMFGPNVTIITGDHRTDLIGEYMRNVTNDMKLPENDKPVVIEDDVWIGAGVTILKGVTIGRGSIISAGAVVRKNVPPYTIFFSHEKTRPRFTEQQIEEHERILREKYPEDFLNDRRMD